MTAAVWSWPGDLSVHATEPCTDCGLPHTRERRAAVLRRALPAASADLLDAHPHIWPNARLLTRDLHALGAKRSAGGEWSET